MAEVTAMPQKHKKRSVKESREQAAPAPDPPESATPAAEPAPPSPTPPGKGKPAKKPTASADDSPFFKLVDSVPAEDWGTRAFIYVYVTEPICNLKAQGNTVYLVRSSAPITDLQGLMEDYGSFKGYMTLNRRKAGPGIADMIDRHDFEIYNPKYPPKIPKAVWMKDPRNARWEALLPPEAPPQSQAQANANDPAKMFEVFEKMADRMESRFRRDEPEPAPDPADQFNTVVTTAKDLLSMALQGNSADKKPDPLIGFLFARLEAAETRAATLMDKLLDAKTAQPSIDPMKMFDEMMDRADKIKERVAPEQNNGGEGVRASRMNGWQEFGLEMARGLFTSPAVAQLAQGFVIWAMSKNPQQQQNGHQAQQQQQAAQQQPIAGALPQPQNGGPQMKLSAQQLAGMIGPQLISPLLLHLTDREKDGYDLAQWVIDGKGQDAYEFLRNHGEDVIIESFRLSPYWNPQGNGSPGLSSMEPQLRELIHEFCSWPPPESDDEPEPGDAAQNNGAAINLMEDEPENGGLM